MSKRSQLNRAINLDSTAVSIFVDILVKLTNIVNSTNISTNIAVSINVNYNFTIKSTCHMSAINSNTTPNKLSHSISLGLACCYQQRLQVLFF